MPMYRIQLQIRCTQYVRVNAKNEDLARELAESGEGEQEEMDFGDDYGEVISIEKIPYPSRPHF